MASRFDVNRPENFQYTSQYIPLPLEAISNMAKEYSTNTAKGKAIPSQLDILESKLEVAPKDYAKKAEVFKNAHNILNEHIASAKPGDWSKPEFQNKTQTIIAQLASNPIFNTFAINKKYFDTHKTKNPNDLDFTYERDPNDPSGTTYKQDMTGSIIADPKITEYDDPTAAKTGIMVGIKNSSYSIKHGIDYSKTAKVGANNDYNLYQGLIEGKSGVGDPRIAEIARSSTDVYGNSKAGKWETQKLLRDDYDFGSEAQNWDYARLKREAYSGNEVALDIYKEISDKYARDMYLIGAKQRDENITKILDQTTLKDDVAAKKALDKAEPLPESYESEAIQGDQFSPTQDMKFNSNGTLKPVTFDGRPGSKEAGDRIANTGGWLNLDLTGKSGVDAESTKKQLDFVNNIQKQYPELKGLTHEAAVNVYNTAHKSLNSKSIVLEDFPGGEKEKEHVTNDIISNMRGHKYYLTDGNGKTTEGDLSSVLGKLEMSEEEFKKELKEQKVGGYTQEGPTPGASYAEIKGRRVMISAGAGKEKAFTVSHVLDQASKKLQNTVVDFGGYKVAIKTNIDKNGNVKQTFMETYPDENGKDQPNLDENGKPIIYDSLYELKKAEREHFYGK